MISDVSTLEIEELQQHKSLTAVYDSKSIHCEQTHFVAWLLAKTVTGKNHVVMQ